jgi:TATA-box binding protein (TBP) (component of TFIID and TFIIIB)
MAALACARARVAALLRSPPAGPFASNVSAIVETNNVGGSHVGMELPIGLQTRLFRVTQKDFTGTIRQLALGYDPRYTVDATALFFTPGSVQIMGARSADAIRLFIHHICAVLRADGHAPRVQYTSIDNKVVKVRIGFCLDLQRMNGQLHGFATTLSPKFPGLVCTYQSENRIVTFSVFDTGKVMMLGIQDMMLINKIYMRLMAMATQFRVAARAAGSSGRGSTVMSTSAGPRAPASKVSMREIVGKISLAVQAALETNQGAMASGNLGSILDDVVTSVVGQPSRKRDAADFFAP